MVSVVKFKTLGDKLANVKDKALFDLLANALAEIQMQTLGYALGEGRAKELKKVVSTSSAILSYILRGNLLSRSSSSIPPTVL